jgi:hypothetical protein
VLQAGRWVGDVLFRFRFAAAVYRVARLRRSRARAAFDGAIELIGATPVRMPAPQSTAPA